MKKCEEVKGKKKHPVRCRIFYFEILNIRVSIGVFVDVLIRTNQLSSSLHTKDPPLQSHDKYTAYTSIARSPWSQCFEYHRHVKPVARAEEPG